MIRTYCQEAGFNGSCTIPNSAEFHPQRKHLVLEGRYRAQPVEGRSFNIFFCMNRSDNIDDCNMILGSVKLQGNIKATLSTKTSSMFNAAEMFPVIPLIYNPKAIARGDKLVCLEDDRLKKCDAENSDIEKQLAAAAGGKAANVLANHAKSKA